MITIPGKTGDLIHEVTFQPVVLGSSNEVIAVSCFARDVTERAKHLESIEKQNSQLREIAWLQSHRTRAPLANILGLTGLELNSDSSDERNQLLRLLQDSAIQLDQVIKEVAQKIESS